MHQASPRRPNRQRPTDHPFTPDPFGGAHSTTAQADLSDGPLTHSDPSEVRTTSSNSVPLSERLALSIEEAGALLGISRDLAYDLVARHELPSIRLGRRLVVPRRALEDLLQHLTETG